MASETGNNVRYRTIEAIRIERERREQVAAERASKLEQGLDLYASDKAVMARYPKGCLPTAEVVVRCESHWDACLVLLAYGKAV